MQPADNVVVRLPARLPKYGDELVPAGEYGAVLVGSETWARCHGWAPRVVLVFVIADAGHMGVAIPGYYRVSRLDGKPRRNGRFVIGGSTRPRLYRDLARMLGRRPEKPLTQIPGEVFGRAYRIVVRDVEIDQDKHPLGAAAYSIVDWVKGAE